MKLLAKINQREALRQGIDATQSTSEITLDPAALTADQRAWIADRLDADGYTLRAGVILVRGTSEELIALADQAIAARAAEQATWREIADAAVRAAISSRATETIGLCGDGREGHPADGLITVRVPRIPSTPSHESHASPELVAELDRVREELRAARAAAIEEALPRLRVAAAQREREEEEALREIDALYDRLEPELRERWEAGFADEDELRKAMRSLARADAGYAGYTGWERSESISSLSDDEFRRLREIEAAAPGGATVEPMRVYDGGGYRAARDDDDPDEIDNDGEVAIPRENVRRVVTIDWTVGWEPDQYLPQGKRPRGLKVRAVLPLS